MQATVMEFGLRPRKRRESHISKDHLPKLYEACDAALKKYKAKVAAEIASGMHQQHKTGCGKAWQFDWMGRRVWQYYC